MKKLLLICFLAVPFFCLADTKTDTLDKLPAAGYLLKNGWKFHAGDKPDWAAPAVNDDNWQSIDPTLLISDLPQVRNAQIGWFRLKLHFSDTLKGKNIALAIQQMGASEIYLNGTLLIKYGKVSANYANEETYDPRIQPLTVQLNGSSEQVLAIRYSINKHNWYAAYGRKVLSVTLNKPEAAWDVYNTRLNRYSHRSFVFGVFIILSMLHFAIYLAYKSRKLNLYLAGFTCLQALTFLDGLTPSWRSNLSYEFYRTIFYLAAPATFVYLLFMVYDLFGQPKTIWIKLLALLALPITFFQLFAGVASVAQSPYAIVIYLETIRVAAHGLKLKVKGAKLLLIGQVTAMFFFCAFNLYNYYHLNLSYILLQVLVDLAFLPPVIVMSILLAREFAENNIALQLQLKQVEELSHKSLLQEQEKQQILASQNELLERQVNERTVELKQSLTNLKATQTQLIQSEKMASLGELTAGIAHEIQNPLNFVNNFSEVSIELLEELKEEAEAGNKADVLAIADDLTLNLQKINHHGKRADFIVKGMLQHSRTSSGERQLTNINVLADEFLKLSYHGLRAKNKNFNADLVTDFYTALPKVNVVQQDIGRVLLNLFNNAFYAVNQKSKTDGTDYKPEVTVSTSAQGDYLIIKVKDNGTGIPDAIKDKIMQPFFTTKPTGEGTGLGLSLSYDIVVKGHGGKINVESKANEGSIFTITLPL